MTARGVMIFAAGFGTRMAPLTDTMPKSMIPILGKPLLDHTFDLVGARAPIIVNTHYLANQIHQHLQGRNIVISHEPDILDTGGGLKKALQHAPAKAMYTVNSDAIWAGPNPLDQLDQHWDDHMQALLLLAHHTSVSGRKGGGDFDLDTQNRLIRGGPYVYLGAQIITSDMVLDHADEVFSLNAIWDKMISQKGAYGCLYTGEWCDVGRPENIPVAENMLRAANV